MHYFGGKQRTAKKIVAFLNQYSSDLDFYEPFVGGFNIRPHFKTHNASDVHEDLILLYQAIQQGLELPDFVDEDTYNIYKSQESSALRGFVGFGCSYSGKWFGGYARDKTGRNYTKNAKNSLFKKFAEVSNVTFTCQDYKEVNPTNAVVYCDPPYHNTTGYTNKFSSGEFWDWVRNISQNNIVVVSEYTAPDDFLVVLEMPTKLDMHSKNGKEPRIEKLFMLKNNS